MVATALCLLMNRFDVEELRLPDGITVTPTGGPCGAVVEGVDLADDLSGTAVHALLTIFNHAGLMILRRQDRLTPERQVEITEYFGKPFERGSYGDKLPSVPSLPIAILADKDGIGGTKELFAHSDVAEYPYPPDVTILHGVVTPPPAAGGSTYFSNLYQAYDELDDTIRRRLEGLRQRPHSTRLAGYHAGVAESLEMAERAGGPPEPDEEPWPVLHPVVRTHPVTGHKTLWVSPAFTHELVGLDDPAEATELVEMLKAHVDQPHLYYKHEWAEHDVLFWDNRCVNHRRDGWDPGYRRIVHRSQAGAARPF